MFARTQRLTLRPGWLEDAPELARAIGHEAVCRNLARAPWPYALDDAEQFLATPPKATTPNFLIFAHEAARVRLIGGIGFEPVAGAPHEFGYWITPDAWGRGYATEAGRAVVQMARHALGVQRLAAGHFIDNPASGRVLRKLGFRATGSVVPRFSRGRGRDVVCAEYALDVRADSKSGDSNPEYCRAA